MRIKPDQFPIKIPLQINLCAGNIREFQIKSLWTSDFLCLSENLHENLVYVMLTLDGKTDVGQITHISLVGKFLVKFWNFFPSIEIVQNLFEFASLYTKVFRIIFNLLKSLRSSLLYTAS